MGSHWGSSVLPWDDGRAAVWADPGFAGGEQCPCVRTCRGPGSHMGPGPIWICVSITGGAATGKIKQV